MEEKRFSIHAAIKANPKWDQMIQREVPLYPRDNDLRSEFERDYTRILHSNAYRRLKHKTQVFFSPANDHICTRSEHVSHVDSISYTIANYLGLNTTLTKAIATAHDVGHSPFGHQGEKVLNEIALRDTNAGFWHEQNGLNFVDNIELLEDEGGNKKNLDLTYAVRDGIISHCGEINENALKPREKCIDLVTYEKPNQFSPFTWEACVVKIADKISYVGRDIKDALSLGILNEKNIEKLSTVLSYPVDKKMNNTVVINNLIQDLCLHSSPKDGLILSNENLSLMNKMKEFNYRHIYLADPIKPAIRYFALVLNQIYDTLKSTYNGENTGRELKKLARLYPRLSGEFLHWIEAYWNVADRKDKPLKNKVIFDMKKEEDYSRAIITYISGMTDNYAIETYNEIIHF